MRRTAALTALIALVSAGPVRADETHGPYRAGNLYPLHSVHHSSRPQLAEVLAPGELELRVAGAWTNTYATRDTYVVDAESRQLGLELAYGTTSGWEFGGRTSLEWRGEGDSDGFIEGWHDAFGLPNGRRERVERDRYLIAGALDGGETFAFRERGTSLGLTTLSARRSVFSAEDTAISMVAELALPSAERGFGGHAPDGSLGALYSETGGRWGFYSGTSVIWFGDTSVGGAEYHRFHPEGFLGVSYGLFDRLSLNVTMYAGGAVLEDVSTHPDYFVYLDLGGRIPLGNGAALELMVRENPVPGSGTSDVSLLGALTLMRS